MAFTTLTRWLRPPSGYSFNASRLTAWIRETPVQLQERSPYLLLVISCSTIFLDLANLSAITIALPTIEKEFGVKIGDLQWVISAYALTFGAFLLLGGRGGDIFGHRTLVIFGMSFFALFTLICGLAPTFIGLVIARAFQGIGAAFTIPSAQAFISLTFPDPKARAFALGIWGASASAGFIVGLILGGILTDFLGWRWVFWISLLVSGLVIPAACLVLPQTNPRGEEEEIHNTQPHGQADRSDRVRLGGLYRSILRRLVRFDVLGIILGLPGILLLNYAFSAANTIGWGKGQIIGTLIASVILLCTFGYHEQRTSVSLLPTELFRIPSFNVNLILAAIAFAIRQSCTYFLTLQLQSYGNSPMHTAVLCIPLGVAAVISIFFSGKLLSAIGPRKMFLLGHLLALPGVILFSFITSSSSYWAFTFPGMVLYIMGIGFVYVTANFVTVSSAHKADQGAASAMFNVALQVGGSVLGLAALTAVAEGISKKFGTESSTRVNAVGYRAVYYSCAILCALGLVLSFFGTRRGTGDGESATTVVESVREGGEDAVVVRLEER